MEIVIDIISMQPKSAFGRQLDGATRRVERLNCAHAAHSQDALASHYRDPSPIVVIVLASDSISESGWQSIWRARPSSCSLSCVAAIKVECVCVWRDGRSQLGDLLAGVAAASLPCP